MDTPSNSAHPPRRHHKPLPRCLTRLLEPSGSDAGHSAAPAVRPETGVRSYARVLAAVWLDLDRLAQLTPQPPPPLLKPSSR